MSVVPKSLYLEYHKIRLLGKWSLSMLPHIFVQIQRPFVQGDWEAFMHKRIGSIIGISPI